MKSYIDDDETNYRRSIWQRNHELIEKHNSEGHSFTIGHNKFSDLTVEEFSQMLKGFNSDQHVRSQSNAGFNLSASKNPPSVDWRDKGGINPVQDQGQFGSCYAFAALTAIEAQYYKITGQLVKLSG